MKRISAIVGSAEDQIFSTVGNIKSDLGITVSTDDAYLGRALAAASADIVMYCNRSFLRDTIDDTFFMDGCHSALVLSRTPVASVTSVTQAGTVLDPTGYTFDAATGIIYRVDTNGNLRDWEILTTVVRFIGGYEDVPADLEAACIAMVKSKRSNRTRANDLKSEKIPDVYEATYWVAGPGDGSFPVEIGGTLDRYREITI
jgi:hypothetical protein